MGQYKVPQDVEAEDKIIGFLTLKQFIYAVIGASWGALSFALFRQVPIFFVAIGVPPALLFLMLGLYRRQDQPFEALFLALLSFWTKPRRRIWEKEPIAEVFTLEPAPIKAEPITRNREEVRGQLEKLVHVIESRSGGTKQPELQEPTLQEQVQASDRLYMPEHLQESSVPSAGAEISKQDDVLDFENNPNSQNLDQLIEGAVQQVREKAIHNMQSARGVSGPEVRRERSPSASNMTVSPPDDILKQTLVSSDLPVSLIAERASAPDPNSGQIKEGEVVKFEAPGRTDQPASG